MGAGLSGGLVSRLSTLAAKPLTANIDVGMAALVFVIFVCVSYLWSHVLKHMG